MRTLKAMALPTLLFVNKIDRPGARYESLLADIKRWLTPSAISMRDPQTIAEILADHNEDVLKSYLYETVDAQTLHDELATQTQAALVHPVFFGSAVTGPGSRTRLAPPRVPNRHRRTVQATLRDGLHGCHASAAPNAVKATNRDSESLKVAFTGIADHVPTLGQGAIS
jgi:peptide subunit release factor RF-3